MVALNRRRLLKGFGARALVAGIAVTSVVLAGTTTFTGMFFCAGSVTGRGFITGGLGYCFILFRFIRV